MDFNLPGIDTTELAAKGVPVALKRVDGSPLLNALGEPVKLVLLGMDSPAYTKASRELARKRVERAQQGGKSINDDALDAAEQDAVDLLVACTTGWEGVLDSKDKPVPFTTEAVRTFYQRFRPAREQADGAIVDRTRFIKPSSEG